MDLGITPDNPRPDEKTVNRVVEGVTIYNYESNQN